MVLGLLISCSPHTKEIKRPIDSWILRSVLDYRPRMITLTLDSAFFVAYDLDKCGLYRAWKGGVNWEGIVYTDTKAMQPTTWGADYILDELLSTPWSIEVNGKTNKLDAKFRGYRLEQQQIFLMYSLIWGKDTLLVEERPEFIRDEQGNPGLERLFQLNGNSSDATVFITHQSEPVKIKFNDQTVIRSFFDPLPEQVNRKTTPVSEDVGRYWLQKSDCFTCHEWAENTVGPGFQQIADQYPNNEENVRQLVNKVKEGGSGVWGNGIMNPHPGLGESDIKSMVKYILSLRVDNKTSITNNAVGLTASKEPPTKPGFGAPLDRVHPSYDLSTIHPDGVEFRVGGMAFLPDGRLVISTWTPEGSVYILSGVETGDPNRVGVKLIATGLAEPLGLEVVDGDIFVLQKQELTQLIDLDGDDIIDEYRAICNGFEVSTDFHEFAFGLIYKDDHFYANLSLPMRLMASEKPLPDRGRVVKIAMDGSFEWLNYGLRQPNGIGIGVDNEVFITDNQGEWLPANKFIHVRPGDYHGMGWVLPDSLSGLEMVQPTVWLPQHEIANSPSEPSLMQDGPYSGQMIYGDVSHGGIKRVFLEKINGSYQGAVFRFTQGLEAGVNRIRWGPDGALYIGGVGMIGGWSWKENRHGLQRMKYNGNSTFEMLQVQAKSDGFDITFTEPLSSGVGKSSDEYLIQQWWYQPTKSYGGPKMDLETLKIKAVEVSPDGTKVHLEIPGLKSKHVVYFRLNDQLKSATGQKLWSSETWYTLNNIPSN